MECLICYEAVRCTHAYHYSCLSEWEQTNPDWDGKCFACFEALKVPASNPEEEKDLVLPERCPRCELRHCECWKFNFAMAIMGMFLLSCLIVSEGSWSFAQCASSGKHMFRTCTPHELRLFEVQQSNAHKMIVLEAIVEGSKTCETSDAIEELQAHLAAKELRNLRNRAAWGHMGEHPVVFTFLLDCFSIYDRLLSFISDFFIDLITIPSLV